MATIRWYILYGASTYAPPRNGLLQMFRLRVFFFVYFKIPAIKLNCVDVGRHRRFKISIVLLCKTIIFRLFEFMDSNELILVVVKLTRANSSFSSAT